MNLTMLWAPVRFIGHKTSDIKKNINKTMVTMNEDAFGKESTLQKIVKENKEKTKQN